MARERGQYYGVLWTNEQGFVVYAASTHGGPALFEKRSKAVEYKRELASHGVRCTIVKVACRLVDAIQ